MDSVRKHNLRRWILDTAGDGSTVPCAGCNQELALEAITLDHYPVLRRHGGTLRRGNVRPMCAECNHSHLHEPGYEEDQTMRTWVRGSLWRISNPLTYKLRSKLDTNLYCWCRHTVDDHNQGDGDPPCDRCRCDGFKEQWSSIRHRLDRQYRARSSPIWADSKRSGKE